MFNLKELVNILLAVIILSIAIWLFKGITQLPTILISLFLIIILNTFIKKITAFYLDSHIEIKPWKIERYWFGPRDYFKRPFPAGFVFPILFSLISFGKFVWLAALSFDVKPEIYKVAKRHGIYSYSEVSEGQIGTIAAAGVFMNIVLSIIGYFLGYSEFSRLNIYFAFFNLIPFSDLDGNKIFFGNFVLWCFLVAIIFIGLAYTFFLV
ncbi:MAG: hypothetical protein QXU40_00515 [Candidatus Pacearchaeota archaeon]